jgi:hypothetical protein
MINLVTLASLGKRGYAGEAAAARTLISGVEHGHVELPVALLKADGSLNIYTDVLKLFRPTYVDNKPAIQCGGWVGYIPLNQEFALEVATRVPVGNLERLVQMASGYSPRILETHFRRFGDAQDRPANILDVIADQLIECCHQIRRFGLLKQYSAKLCKNASPVGRLRPFETEWRSSKARKPIAVSTSFHRTPDIPPNRVLKFALLKLTELYFSRNDEDQHKRRRELSDALASFESVSVSQPSELSGTKFAKYIREIPYGHDHYVNAILLAQILLNDAGVGIRGTGEYVILPSILIDMSKVFEDYLRRLLVDAFAVERSVSVLDGNLGGEFGAKTELFDSPLPSISNPPVTPDIVIKVDGAVRLVIDAKYKPAPKVPTRDDINQVILYGAKYNTVDVMVAHADRSAERSQVERCGRVGPFNVYNGMIDLNATDMKQEEARFAENIRSIIHDASASRRR